MVRLFILEYKVDHSDYDVRIKNVEKIVDRLHITIYEGNDNLDSICVLTQAIREIKPRIIILENRLSSIHSDDRRARSQILWALVVLIIMGIAKFFGVDLNYFKGLIGL